MIQQNELRLGNYISYGDEVVQVAGIGFNNSGNAYLRHLDERFISKASYCGYLLDQHKPIPLTEEWIVKFGFHIDRENLPSNSLDTVSLWVRKDFFIFHDRIENVAKIDLMKAKEVNVHVTTCINYVHQLQNLYHALTGKEL